MWFTDNAITGWAAAPRTTHGGQPWYSPLAILTALTLRAVFCLAYRQAEGLLGSIVDLLGLSLPVPDHTALSRRAATLEVPRPGNAGAGAGGEPMHLLVDSTGLKLCGKGKWLLEEHGTVSTPVQFSALVPKYNPLVKSANQLFIGTAFLSFGGRPRRDVTGAAGGTCRVRMASGTRSACWRRR